MSAAQTPPPGLIQFAEIPTNWRVPGNYMEVKNAVNDNAVLPFPARGLVMGQFYSTAQAVAGTVYTIYSGDQANQLFGTGSILAEMCWSFIRANPYTPFDAIPIADATGAVAATGKFTFAGTATAAGTVALYLASVRVAVGVNVGDTAAIVAANAYAAIQQQGTPGNKVIPSLLASYTAASAIVNLTAGNAGTLGNQLDLRVNFQTGDVLPPGITVAVTPMAGGATDPSATIATSLAGLVSTWYTDIAFPWTDTTNIGVLTNWITPRYGAMVKLDCQAYVALNNTYGTALTFLPNSKFITPLPVQNSLSPSWKIAASMAGACCYSSAQQPSLQMKRVPLPGIVAPAQADQFTLSQREFLLQAGLSTYYGDNQGNVYLERATTSYRIDPGTGVQDPAWFDLNSVKVPTRVRYDWNSYMELIWPRNNLTNDGTIAAAYDPLAVTPSMLKASWTARSAVYEKNGWIQNSAATAANSTFVIDANDGNRVDARQQINIMGNLMVLAGSLEFISNN